MLFMTLVIERIRCSVSSVIKPTHLKFQTNQTVWWLHNQDDNFRTKLNTNFVFQVYLLIYYEEMDYLCTTLSLVADKTTCFHETFNKGISVSHTGK